MIDDEVELVACSFCGATGEVWDEDFVFIVPCPVCDGVKQVIKRDEIEQITSTNGTDQKA